MIRFGRKLAALFLVVGIVPSPQRAVAATSPMFIAYDAAVQPTAKVRVQTKPSLRPELGGGHEYVYDDAHDGYDDASNSAVVGDAGADHACDRVLELAARPGANGERAIYGDPAPTTAAEGSGGALSDSALVCRGGTCTAERFAGGSGVTLDANGNLQGVSVNSANGATLEELTATIPNRQVGVTTVGDVRAAGGDVLPSPTRNNPFHCTLCSISPQKAEQLFTPTVANPNR